MARFVQQGTLGGYRDVSGGASDSNLTHVIFTKAEYKDIYVRINRLEYENREIQEKYNKEIERYKRDCERAVEVEIARSVASYKDQSDKLMERINDLKNELETTATERDVAEQLNENLIRIARERANQDQNIRPKKQKYGYKILSKREYKQRYDKKYSLEEYKGMSYEWQEDHPWKSGSNAYIEHTEAFVWKSILTTPYRSTMKKDDVEQLIFKDLEKCRYDMGMPGWHRHNGEYVGRYVNTKSKEPVNTLYRWELVADYIRGYWQIEMYTTDELDDSDGGTW